ncbi:MAG: hypothetical protein RQ875_01720 [Vicingaceae bacterium]|nr:hypothetical protein [Vicingaceae bacterium]
MELLKEIFSQTTTQQFIKICEEISKTKTSGTINGIGINFSENEIESVKLYYGFHEPLTDNEINQLHIFGEPTTYYQIKKKLSNTDYAWADYYPTGVSFALKIDKYMNFSFGHFMMPKIEKNDLFFTLSPIIEHYQTTNLLPIYHRKGIFTLINKDGIEHQKDYFYITHPDLKRKIGKSFNVDTSIVPSIEWVLGIGFYAGSSPNDEKIVLQSNYNDVYHHIIRKEQNQFIKEFNNTMHKKYKMHCVCPGYYKKKDIKSYYYLNSKITNPNNIESISLFNKLLQQ